MAVSFKDFHTKKENQCPIYLHHTHRICSYNSQKNEGTTHTEIDYLQIRRLAMQRSSDPILPHHP